MTFVLQVSYVILPKPTIAQTAAITGLKIALLESVAY
jgi:hypothetical protein